MQLLFMAAACTMLAHAEEPGLADTVKNLGTTQVSDSAYFADDTQFEDGACHVFFDDGLFVPIMSLDTQPEVLGLVFVGEGRMQVRLRPHEAQALGNHLVLRAGMSSEEARELLAGNVIETPIKKGVIFSSDPRLGILLDGLEKAGASYFEEGGEGEDATYVVTPSKGKLMAQAVARNLWPERRNLLVRSGIEPEGVLGIERLVKSRTQQQAGETLLLADFLTTERLGAVLGSQKMLGREDADRWLTCLRDGSGLLELGAEQVIFSHGLDAQDDYQNVQIASTERVNPTPQTFSPIGAHVTLDIKTRRRGRLVADAQSVLSLRAEYSGAQHLLLRLPREHTVQEDWEMDPPTLIDGTPLQWAVLEFEDTEQGLQSGLRLMNPNKAIHHDLLVELPRPLQKDEQVSLNLNWRSGWILGKWASDQAGSYQLGPTTGLLRFLPDVLPLGGGTSWSFSINVRAKAKRGLDIAVSGNTLEEQLDEDTLDLTIESGALFALEPRIVLGRWRSYQEDGAASLPAVQAMLLPGQTKSALQEFPAEVRRVLTYYDRFLPPIEIPEFEVYQDTDSASIGLGETGHGLLEVHQVFGRDRTRLDKYDPDMGQAMLARSIANQYWSHLVYPAGPQDAWLSTVLSEIFAAYYLRNGNGIQSYDERIDSVRELLEDPAEQENWFGDGEGGKDNFAGPGENLSLTRFSSADLTTPDLVRYYGLVVVGEMLRTHMLDREFFSALDSLIRDHRGGPITTTDFQNAMEESSGQNLDDFFSFWIHGGLIPELELKYQVKDTGELIGCLHANVPFGTFDVPLSITTKEKTLAPVITVKDGLGRIRLDLESPAEEIMLDPEGRLLATKRKVSRFDTLSCTESVQKNPAIAP